MILKLVLCLPVLLPWTAQAKVVRITRDEVRCVTVARDDGTTTTRCSVRRVHGAPPPAELQPLPVPRLQLPPPLDPGAVPDAAPEELPAPAAPQQVPPAADGDHHDPAPFPAPTPPTPSVTEEERAVVDLLNAERDRRGLGRLALDPSASAAARAHSRDMCRRHYFSHVSPEGKRPWDRLRAAGARFGTAAENIAVGYRSPAEVHRGWLDSPGHRGNRLDPRFTRVGVGVHDCDGVQYWTELFAGPVSRGSVAAR